MSATEGGKPDDALDKVAAVLGPICDGFGSDAVEDVMEEPLVVVVRFDPNYGTPVDPLALSSRYPRLKKSFFSTPKSKGKLKRQAVADDVIVNASIVEKNRAIAAYYDMKRRKVELDILELEKKLLSIQR